MENIFSCGQIIAPGDCRQVKKHEPIARLGRSPYPPAVPERNYSSNRATMPEHFRRDAE
jgi:hypothetical protein